MSKELSRRIVLASAVGLLLAPASALAAPPATYDSSEPDGFSSDPAVWWAGPDAVPDEAARQAYDATAPDGNVPGPDGTSPSVSLSGPAYDASEPDGNVPRLA